MRPAPLKAVGEQHDGELYGAVRVRQVDEGGLHARAAFHHIVQRAGRIPHLHLGTQ